jgi:hypothetical protein
MSWIQPLGYVHGMIADTWASKGLQVDTSGTAKVSAQHSDSGDAVYIRAASDTSQTIALKAGGKPVSGTVKQTTLSNDDLGAANSPGAPVSPAPH